MFSELRGITISQILKGQELDAYIQAIDRAIETWESQPVSYHIKGQRFIAILQPLDDTVVRVHEVRVRDDVAAAVRTLQWIEASIVW